MLRAAQGEPDKTILVFRWLERIAHWDGNVADKLRGVDKGSRGARSPNISTDQRLERFTLVGIDTMVFDQNLDGKLGTVEGS